MNTCCWHVVSNTTLYVCLHVTASWSITSSQIRETASHDGSNKKRSSRAEGSFVGRDLQTTKTTKELVEINHGNVAAVVGAGGGGSAAAAASSRRAAASASGGGGSGVVKKIWDDGRIGGGSCVVKELWDDGFVGDVVWGGVQGLCGGE